MFRKFDFQTLSEMYFSFKAEDAPFKSNKVPWGNRMMQFVTSYPVQYQLSDSLFSWLHFAVERVVTFITTKPHPGLMAKVTNLLC